LVFGPFTYGREQSTSAEWRVMYIFLLREKQNLTLLNFQNCLYVKSKNKCDALTSFKTFDSFFKVFLKVFTSSKSKMKEIDIIVIVLGTGVIVSDGWN